MTGDSMRPTLAPGDRLVAVRLGRPRAGWLVAVVDPRTTDRLMVKRVGAVRADGRLELSGDNPAASTDSRTFGPVSLGLVRGRVVWRYAPAQRRGKLLR